MTKWPARIGWWILCAIVTASLVSSTVFAQAGYPQRIDPFINDYAALLSTEDAGAVRGLLADLKAAHGIEVVVVTIESISTYQTGDATIELFALHLFNTWGIGDKIRNDGVLLLVAVNDHKVRIELGSSYGNGPSQEMQDVIDRYVLPSFRQSNYSAGIRIGIQAMIAKLLNQPMPEIDESAEPITPVVPSVPVGTTQPAADSSRTLTESIGSVLAAIVVATLVLIAVKEQQSSSARFDSARSSQSWGSGLDNSSRNHNDSDNNYSGSDNTSGNDSGGSSSGGGATGSW